MCVFIMEALLLIGICCTIYVTPDAVIPELGVMMSMYSISKDLHIHTYIYSTLDELYI